MKVHLNTLGCRLNEAELEQWAALFTAAGDEIVGAAADADIAVLNTCAVTREAVAKSRRRIARLQRDNPEAKIVVSGCYSALESPAALADLGIDLVVSNTDKSALVSRTRETFADLTMPAAATEPDYQALFRRSRHRAFVKIQDGCRHRCTYCIVTRARGEERSRSIDELVRQVQRLTDEGVREVVLTGVHVGGYGTDIGSELADLVIALLERTAIERLRFASVEPWDLSPRFIELFAEARLMPHMHLPLQSGSDTLLKRMARRCRSEEFARLVEDLRRIDPTFNITTDVIVGFPGETETLWRESLDFIASQPFGHIHVFAFSAREGTPAASFADPVAEAIKQERSRELHVLAATLKRQQLENMLGRTSRVLWESGKPLPDASGRQRYRGYTENYHRVAIESDLPLSNQLSEPRFSDLDAGKLVIQEPGDILPSVHPRSSAARVDAPSASEQPDSAGGIGSLAPAPRRADELAMPHRIIPLEVR